MGRPGVVSAMLAALGVYLALAATSILSTIAFVATDTAYGQDPGAYLGLILRATLQTALVASLPFAVGVFLAFWVLVPIAPHALTHRPIAVPDSSTIDITVNRGRDAAVHCDGQARFDLAEGERVTARRATHAARFLHPEHHDYFAMLREKLHWSETPERLYPAGNGR